MIRAHVYYSGQVQGVGFRFTCRQLASRHVVGGFVRNLPDGRVELVAEGDRRQVSATSERHRRGARQPYSRQGSVRASLATPAVGGLLDSALIRAALRTRDSTAG